MHPTNYGELSFRVNLDSSFATNKIDEPFTLEVKGEKYTVKVFRKTYYNESMVIDAQLFTLNELCNNVQTIPPR